MQEVSGSWCSVVLSDAGCAAPCSLRLDGCGKRQREASSRENALSFSHRFPRTPAGQIVNVNVSSLEKVTTLTRVNLMLATAGLLMIGTYDRSRIIIVCLWLDP